ncbi:alpha/beta hydrolase fold protein [Tanacetum coccineum]
METLTLKGPPCGMRHPYHNDIRITPWTEQLALEFRYLKELHIRHLVVHDEDLETLARTRGKDLRSLKISKCIGFSTDGLRHVFKYCNQLRTLCLRYSYYINVKDGIWLHQLALNSIVLERLHVTNTDISEEDLTLLVKNYCNSLISLKIGKCYLSKLGDAFRYAVRLDHFGGYNCDEESELVGFQLPQNTRSLSIKDLPVTRYSILLPFLNHIRKLKLVFFSLDDECQCLLLKRCPNLEVLYIDDACGDKVLTTNLELGNGILAMLMGCKKLESLDISSNWRGGLTDVGLEYIGKYGRNMRFLSLTRIGNSNAGLVKLSEGCPRLRKLKLRCCPFSKQVVTSSVFNIPTLRLEALKVDKPERCLTKPSALTGLVLRVVNPWDSIMHKVGCQRIAGSSKVYCYKHMQGRKHLAI